MENFFNPGRMRDRAWRLAICAFDVAMVAFIGVHRALVAKRRGVA